MKLATVYLAFIFLAALSTVCYSQEKEQPDEYKKIKILPVPTFGHSPETGTYVGAVSLFTLDMYNDTLTRTSNAKLEFSYTWRKQLILESGWNYFFRHEKWFTQGLLHYSKYPDLYYGMGEETPADNEVFYESRRVIVDLNFLKKIKNRLFLGPKFRYLNYYSLDYDRNMIYPELDDAYAWGIGYTLLKDTRNNLLNPTEGVYGEVTNTYSSSSVGQYVKLYLDGRIYRHTKNNKVTGALRLFNEFTFGDAPFFDMALAGGDKRIRGYYFGRYRERNLTTLQAEVRTKVVWRFGLAVFGGLSKLYPDMASLSFNDIKPNYGAGIRFLIDRKQNINLRIDYARGIDGQSGFYIAFGESF